MAQLTFTKTSTGSYQATATVNADFNLHIEKEYGYPARLAVLVKTAGTNYMTAFDENVPQTFEHDFDAIVYPKTVMVVSSVAVTSGIITEAE